MRLVRIPSWSGQVWRVVRDHPLSHNVEVEAVEMRDDTGQPVRALAPRSALVEHAARRTDPSTSHEAARSITAAQLHTDTRLVLSLLHQYGPMNDFELAARASEAQGYTRKQTSLGKRRGELADAGMVADSGLRRPSDTGRPSIVWALTAEGRRVFTGRAA